MDSSRLDRRAITLLGLGHFTDDYNQSFLPALLPLFVAQRHLSLTAVGALVLAAGISSSVVQPAIGFLADRRAMPWIAGVGLLFAGGGIALIGFMPSYLLLFCCALLSGLGVAMFHPEAARFANLASGAKKASGMRWFALGGNVGFAIGPMFATVAVALYGLPGTFLAGIPAGIMGVLLILEGARMRGFLPRVGAKHANVEQADDWAAFTRLTVLIMVRSIGYLGLISFIPLYFVHVVHVSPTVANLVLTAFLAAGIAGTIVGGPLADQHGRRAVIGVSIAASLVCVLALVGAAAGPGSLALAAGFVAALALGAVITGSQAAMIVLGQEYLPGRIGTASGVTLGLAVSVGAIFAPVLGAIGDRWGLHATMLAIAAVFAVALALVATLPATQRLRRTAPPQPVTA